MTESADLARQVASQLGGDLNQILGSLATPDAALEPDAAPGSPQGDQQSPKRASKTTVEPLELCQIAGRGAGQRVLLTPGTYDIGPTTSPPGMPGNADPQMVSFRLTVGPSNDVVLTTITHPVAVDGRQIADGLRLKGGHIDAYSARFVLGPPNPNPRPAPTSAQINAALPTQKIPVSEIKGASIEHKTKRRSKNKRNRTPEEFPELTRAVLQARARKIRRIRMLNPDMAELLNRVRLGRSHIWNIDKSDQQFGHTTVAYGEIPWTPPYDRPDKIRDEAAYAVNQFLELPTVPITLDMQRNALGIVGPRDTALAVARHIGIGFCITTSPRDIELAIMADSTTAQDWQWAELLPHAQPGNSDSSAMPLLMIDGLAQVGANELRAMLAETTNLGAIVIESELGDLPSICGTVMELRPDGSGALMDFRRGKTINGRATPAGMSASMAVDAARHIAHAASPQAQGPSPSARVEAKPEIAVPDHIKRPESRKALPQRKR